MIPEMYGCFEIIQFSTNEDVISDLEVTDYS